MPLLFVCKIAYSSLSKEKQQITVGLFKILLPELRRRHRGHLRKQTRKISPVLIPQLQSHLFRSIIGKKPFIYTTKQYIVCRMIGVKSPAYLKEALKKKELKKIYTIYSKRYHMDKMLDNLTDNKFLVKMPVPPLRRIYISTRLTLSELGDAVYESFMDKKNRVRNRKEEERKEAWKLIQRLFNNKPDAK